MLQPKASIAAIQTVVQNGPANHPVQDWDEPAPEPESGRGPRLQPPAPDLTRAWPAAYSLLPSV